MAEKILMREYKELSKEQWVNISLLNEDILTWSIALIILNPSSLYYTGYFRATMTFPPTYPYTPPTFQFSRPLYHPNIYPDGKLCISILHSPGEDEMSGESAGERWSPVQRVESVLLSIVSLLDDAETSSPANVDAGVLLRRDKEAYRKRVAEDVVKSRGDIPEGFVMPTHESTVPKRPEKKVDDDREFWVDSEEEDEDEMDMEDEDGAGGSDTDEDDDGGDDGEGVSQEEVEMMEDAEDEDSEGEMQEFLDEEEEREKGKGEVKDGKAS